MKNLFFIIASSNGFAINFRGVNLLNAVNLEPAGIRFNYGRALEVRDEIISGTYAPEIQEKFNNLK